MAVFHIGVNIFIRQINSPGKRRVSVDHGDFSVIPVIVNSGKHWNKGIEHLALNSLFPQLSLIIRRQGGQAAHAVEKKPHVYPFFHLFFQDLQNAVPHDSFLDDKIL